MVYFEVLGTRPKEELMIA